MTRPSKAVVKRVNRPSKKAVSLFHNQFPNATTAENKYVFLDVVSYSHKRTAEAQTDIIAALNSVVRAAVADLELDQQKVLYIPTGDGICIALVNMNAYDAHVKLALKILRNLAVHKRNQKDSMRQFDIRVGINENVDNLINDINGNRNVSGAGINMAARIMDAADAGQILVGNAVYERLSQREAYHEKFQEFTLTAKHGIELPVFQLRGFEHINQSEPTRFAPSPKLAAEKLSELGVVEVYKKRSEINWHQLIATAKVEVRILSTSLNYWQAIDRSVWESARQKGCIVRLLSLDPDSQYAAARGNDVDKVFGRGKGERFLNDIRNSGNILRRIVGDSNIRFYDAFPYVGLALVDRFVFVNWNLRERRGRELLHFQFSEQSEMGRLLKGYFDHVWRIAKSISAKEKAGRGRK